MPLAEATLAHRGQGLRVDGAGATVRAVTTAGVSIRDSSSHRATSRGTVHVVTMKIGSVSAPAASCTTPTPEHVAHLHRHLFLALLDSVVSCVLSLCVLVCAGHGLLPVRLSSSCCCTLSGHQRQNGRAGAGTRPAAAPSRPCWAAARAAAAAAGGVVADAVLSSDGCLTAVPLSVV